MSITNEPGGSMPDKEPAQPPAGRIPLFSCSPLEFFQDMARGMPAGYTRAIVTNGPGGKPNDHAWHKVGEDFAEFAVRHSHESHRAYFSMACYHEESLSRFVGRKAENAQYLNDLRLDLDTRNCVDANGVPYTHGDEKTAYPDRGALTVALKRFIAETGLTPTHIVETGSGGLQVYFVLDAALPRDAWQKRANALHALTVKHGLITDAPCTTDAARIMRAPGSFHNRTGKLVVAHRVRLTPYTLDEIDTLLGYTPETVPAAVGLSSVDAAGMPNINEDILGSYDNTPANFERIVAECPTLAAMVAAPTGVPPDLWFRGMQIARYCTDPEDALRQISEGHPRFDEAEDNKRMLSLDKGPVKCEKIRVAGGTGCDGCKHAGRAPDGAWMPPRFGSPVMLGRGAVAVASEVFENDPAAPGWVKELNASYALVRVGSDVTLVDFNSPRITALGMVYDFGYLKMSSFITLMKGRFSPPLKDDERPKPLAPAWLGHPGRRQYAGLVYAPGEALPSNILNLWQGFAVEPMAGDVSLWLQVLEAVVTNDADRLYVLRWLAWKIQNPGGVPDTILIFKGAKGAGKNSIFDPIVLLFGRHGMATDEPLLIAGQFTIQLMTLSFAMLDEAIFAGDPRQTDRIKSRVTAKTMHYEQKGMDPVQGVNRCAYVMLTNHEYVWQATSDERRAVVIEAGESLRGNLEFWTRYNAWGVGPGPAALLHYLQGIDLTGFNPRQIPKGEALRKQIELTALREPAAAWWHLCLTEGAIRWRVNGIDRVIHLDDTTETEIDRAALRQSYEQSTGGRGRVSADWAVVSKRLKTWAGAGGMRTVQVTGTSGRERRDVLAPLPALRVAFTTATSVQVSE